MGYAHDLTNVILPHFDKFHLITKKRTDYLLFKSAIEIINKKPLKNGVKYKFTIKFIILKCAKKSRR